MKDLWEEEGRYYEKKEEDIMGMWKKKILKLGKRNYVNEEVGTMWKRRKKLLKRGGRNNVREEEGIIFRKKDSEVEIMEGRGRNYVNKKEGKDGKEIMGIMWRKRKKLWKELWEGGGRYYGKDGTGRISS